MEMPKYRVSGDTEIGQGNTTTGNIDSTFKWFELQYTLEKLFKSWEKEA